MFVRGGGSYDLSFAQGLLVVIAIELRFALTQQRMTGPRALRVDPAESPGACTVCTQRASTQQTRSHRLPVDSACTLDSQYSKPRAAAQ